MERVAGELLAAWFGAHAVLPEDAPRLIPSGGAVDRAVSLALELCKRVDTLGLPPAPIERYYKLMEGYVVEQTAAQKRAEASTAEVTRLMRAARGELEQ